MPPTKPVAEPTTDSSQGAKPTDQFAKAAFDLIYNTPPEVMRQMDERLRELRSPRHTATCICCWSAG